VLVANGADSLTDLDRDWIARRSGEMRDRLQAIGLIPDPQAEAKRVAFVDAIDDYCDTMHSWDSATVTAWKTHRKRVFLYFANRPFLDITIGMTRDFKQHLLATLSENSARKTIGCCRQVCKWLVDHERMVRNPFAGQPVAIGKAVDQDYIRADRVERVIEVCNSHEWKLMFVLARFAGMRCPSEPFRAKWSHINWETSRMIVDSPKTGQRVMPLFPDLRRHLSAIHESLRDGAPDEMIPSLRLKSGSLHAAASKMIVRAKEVVWPRLFHNMRSSCQTDLSDIHPISAVCTWLGNSTAIAAKHYLQVKESHFEAAIREAEKCRRNVVAEENDVEKH